MRYFKDYLWITLITIIITAAGILFFMKPSHLPKKVVAVRTETFKSPEAQNEIPQKEPKSNAPLNLNLNLNLRLLGTIISSKFSLAFILDLDSGKGRLYKIDDMLNGAKIISIASGRVILGKDERKQELLLVDGSSNVYKNTVGKPEQVSPGEIIISKTEVIKGIEKAGELFREVKIMAISDNLSNRLKGFRIDNIPKGSIIEQAGLKKGDVIYSIQGDRLASIKDALRIFQSAQNQPRIQADLLRDGQIVTLNWRIRKE